MKLTTTSRTAAAVLLAAGLVIGGQSGPAQAKTDNLGCPSGWTTYQTSFLVDHGFSPTFLAQIDLNLDGIVCGTPLSPQQQEKFCSQFPDGCQQPVILGFRDNTNGKGY